MKGRILALTLFLTALAVPAAAQVTPVIYPPNIPLACADGEGIVYNISTRRWDCGAVGGSGAVGTDSIWDAAGDLVQGTGANTAARLAVGTANQLLRVNAGATAAEWASTLSGLTFVAPVLGAATATSLAFGADPADAGSLRLSNNTVIGWEAATPGTDLTLGVNGSDVLVASGAMTITGAFITSSTSNLSGGTTTLGTVTANGVITFIDNTRQTFNPGADAAGLNVGSIAGDPGTPSNGDLWYDSTANELTARINGANVALGAGGGGAVGTDTIWDAAGDLVQGTGSNTAARLAIGTADQVLRVNAGATAAEWVDLADLGVPEFTDPGADALVFWDDTGGNFEGFAAGTGVLTALGVNVGSAGAFVVNGGALGTPTSGTLALPFKMVFHAAVCQNATASGGGNLPTTLGAAAVCESTAAASGDPAYGTVTFPTGGALTEWHHNFPLPSDWTASGGLHARINWRAISTTANDVVWLVQTGCLEAGAASTAISFNAADAFTADTNLGTTLQHNHTVSQALTTTGCAAGETFYFKVLRDTDTAGDTLDQDVQFIWIEFTYRRAVTIGG
jgi:hypothetical protein